VSDPNVDFSKFCMFKHLKIVPDRESYDRILIIHAALDGVISHDLE